MSTNGCMIGFPNLIDTGAVSGGLYSASYPLTNIQNKLIGRVARTTNTTNTSTTFLIDLGSSKAVRLVSLINHNISLTATWRIRGHDSSIAFADTGPFLYDSGQVNAWGSGATAVLAATITPTTCHILPGIVAARYWRIDVLDTANTNGYVSMGRIFIGPVWQPTYDMELGMNLGWDTNTTQQKALSGSKYFQRRKPYRVASFTLNVINEDEAMQKAFEIDRMAGIDKEVFWVFSATDALYATQRRFLGTLRQLTPIEYPRQGLLKKAYTIEEIV
jgi:hypothetical protein